MLIDGARAQGTIRDDAGVRDVQTIMCGFGHVAGGAARRRAPGLAALPHDRARRAARPVTWSQRLLSVAFITTGILHFLRPEYFEQIVPDYLPAHHEIVLISGAAEIAGGLGVLLTRTRRPAGAVARSRC